MRIHPDKAMRYPCTVEGCSKSVRWPKDMQKHFRTHHSAILWPCKEGGCDVVWGRGDQLLRHLHAEHSKTDNPASDNSIGELTYRRAVDIARITEGDLDPMITAYLKTAVAELSKSLNSYQQSHALNESEVAVSNYFRHRFQGDLGERAVDWYWRSTHQQDGSPPPELDSTLFTRTNDFGIAELESPPLDPGRSTVPRDRDMSYGITPQEVRHNASIDLADSQVLTHIC
jgi:hypothetical protein